MDSGWTVGILALGLFTFIVVVLGIIIWSIRRHRDPHLKIECDAPIDKLVPTLAGLTLRSAVGGN